LKQTVKRSKLKKRELEKVGCRKRERRGAGELAETAPVNVVVKSAVPGNRGRGGSRRTG